MTRALLTAVLLGVLALCAPPRASEGAPAALTREEAASVICVYDWDCGTAMAVAFRESRFQPDAYNTGCRCVGLFQIAGVHGHTYEALTDPAFNTRVAYGLYLQSGWQPWRTQ